MWLHHSRRVVACSSIYCCDTLPRKADHEFRAKILTDMYYVSVWEQLVVMVMTFTSRHMATTPQFITVTSYMQLEIHVLLSNHQYVSGEAISYNKLPYVLKPHKFVT